MLKIVLAAILAAFVTPALAQSECVTFDTINTALQKEAAAIMVVHEESAQKLSDALGRVSGVGSVPVSAIAVFINGEVVLAFGFNEAGCQFAGGIIPLPVFRQIWKDAGLPEIPLVPPTPRGTSI